MAHIHLEDGSFTLFWAAAWWLLAIIAVAVALYWIRRKGKPDSRVITLAALCTAAMFAIFQVEIPLPAGAVHLNMTTLVGILTGPVIGILVVFLVNILSAAIGHGGWGMIGANTLVNASEVLVGYLVFRAGADRIQSLFARAGIATLAGLFVGNCVMVGIILLSGIQGVTQSAAQILWGLSLLVAINMGVAVIEAFITGYIVAYLGRTRPDLLFGKKGGSQ